MSYCASVHAAHTIDEWRSKTVTDQIVFPTVETLHGETFEPLQNLRDVTLYVRVYFILDDCHR